MRRPSPAARPSARLAGLAVALGFAALSALVARPAVAQDVAPAHVFSRLDAPAVAVGETVRLSVEVLAGPAPDAALSVLVAALRDAAPTAGEGLVAAGSSDVTVRRRGRVAEIERHFTFRAVRAGAARVPPVAVATGLVTRPHALRVYAPAPGLRAAAQAVADVRVDGAAHGVGFTRTGAAFLVAPGALVTAYHVVAGARRVTVLGPTGRGVRARAVWALDPVRDVAVLAVDPDDARAAGLVPLALDPVPTAHGEARVAATTRDARPAVAPRYDDLHVDGHRLFASANAVRPGDSGGPLLGATGAVLGVVVSGRTTAGEADLLREDICLAADVRPTVARALDRSASGARPEPLRRALAAAHRSVPVARAMDAASALRLPLPAGGRALYVEALLDAARAEPGHAALQFLAGSALEAVGERRHAADALAGAWAGGHVPAAYALAHHHLRAGDADAALALFEQVRASAPYAHLGAFGVAQAATAAGRFARAEAALDAVLDHDPHFGPALYLLGVVRLAQGRAPEAHALAVRLGPTTEWTAALALLLRAPTLRPEALRPLTLAR